MIELGLFFTRSVGLKTWQTVGSLDRELSLYRRLAEHDVHTTLFCYDNDITDIAKSLPEFSCVPIKASWLTGHTRYLRLGRYQVKAKLANIDIIKTNQFMGGYQALAAAQFHNTALIARAGYLPSRFAKFDDKPAEKIQAIIQEERVLLGHATHTVVTSESMKQYLHDSYNTPLDDIQVIGNYVPDHFSHEGDKAEPCTILTVGRHHRQKAYDLLMDALQGQKDILWRCIGSGPEMDKDKAQAKALNLNTEFIDKVPSKTLPEHLRSTDIFVLCSRYEGHPKVLLEAMACGCACIVTDCPGVNSDIEDAVNGLVIPFDKQALRDAINTLRNDKNLRMQLGKQAQQSIQQRYSLDKIVAEELALYHKVLASK